MSETTATTGYSGMQTVKKFLKVAVYSGVAFLASQVLPFLPSSAETVLLTAVLVAVENYLKHRKD